MTAKEIVKFGKVILTLYYQQKRFKLASHTNIFSRIWALQLQKLSPPWLWNGGEGGPVWPIPVSPTLGSRHPNYACCFSNK